MKRSQENQRLASRLLVLCSTVVAIAIAGCGSSDDGRPRGVVRGMVTLDGSPLPEGEIYFLTPSAGDIERLTILDGNFYGKALPGERMISISVTKMMDPPPSTMPGIEFTEKVPTETLPARYNAETTLTATVSADGPNEFTFELTSDDKSNSSATKKEVSRPR